MDQLPGSVLHRGNNLINSETAILNCVNMTNLSLKQFIIDDKQISHRHTNLQHHSIDKVHIPLFVTRVLLHQLNNELQWEETFTTSIGDTKVFQLASNALLLGLDCRSNSRTKFCSWFILNARNLTLLLL